MRDPPAGARPLVLRNGKIITVNARFEIAQAIALSGGRIDAVGSDADLAPLIDATAQVVDLNGRAVIPGLTDAHLISSVLIDAPTLLWTRDKRLRKAAESLGIHASLN